MKALLITLILVLPGCVTTQPYFQQTSVDPSVKEQCRYVFDTLNGTVLEGWGGPNTRFPSEFLWNMEVEGKVNTIKTMCNHIDTSSFAEVIEKYRGINRKRAAEFEAERERQVELSHAENMRKMREAMKPENRELTCRSLYLAFEGEFVAPRSYMKRCMNMGN